MKLIQVFDWLKMPLELQEDVAAELEASNDTYHRFYPDTSFKPELRERVLVWLRDQGADLEPSTCGFHVLIHVNW